MPWVLPRGEDLLACDRYRIFREMILVPVRLRYKYFGLGRIILSGTIENITGLRLRSLVHIESCSNLLEQSMACSC